ADTACKLIICFRKLFDANRRNLPSIGDTAAGVFLGLVVGRILDRKRSKVAWPSAGESFGELLQNPRRAKLDIEVLLLDVFNRRLSDDLQFLFANRIAKRMRQKL